MISRGFGVYSSASSETVRTGVSYESELELRQLQLMGLIVVMEEGPDRANRASRA